jgi:drug/metabolite transporter (DMT)-like permease
MPRTSTQRGYAAALAAVLIWALVPVGTRFFVLRVDPNVFNVIRFAASGGAALPLFLFAKPWRWSGRDQWLLLLCAAFAVAGYNIPVAIGARTVTAGELGLLIATESVMIVALTSLLHRRPLHGRIMGGSVVALLGVALTSGVFTTTQDFEWRGTLEVLCGAFSWSCYTVLTAPLNRRHGTWGVTGAILVVGTLVLFGISLPSVTTALLPDRTTIFLLGAMGLASSLIGFVLWNYATATVPSERLGLFLYLIPVVSIGGGIEFLSESLSLPILIGGVLIVLGVWTASRASAAAPAPFIE